MEQDLQQEAKFGSALHLPVKLFGSPEHLVGVAYHARPTQLPDSVDHFRGTIAAGRQVPAVNHKIGGRHLDDRLESSEVPWMSETMATRMICGF